MRFHAVKELSRTNIDTTRQRIFQLNLFYTISHRTSRYMVVKCQSCAAYNYVSGDDENMSQENWECRVLTLVKEDNWKLK